MQSCPTLLDLPRHILESVLSYLPFDDVSKIRETCSLLDEICSGILNRGFRQLEKQVALDQAKLRGKLPRRESERRLHPLNRHSETLSAIETRLSLLKISIMRYADEGYCCFFPGKVLDEAHRICRLLQTGSDPTIRPYELLHELRDISSMAIEHFEETLLPLIRRRAVTVNVAGPSWLPSQPFRRSDPVLPRSVPLDEVRAVVSYQRKIRRSVAPLISERDSTDSHISPVQSTLLRDRVKNLERSQFTSAMRYRVLRRTLSHFSVRLREITEQNKRLNELVAAQAKKMQQLETFCATLIPNNMPDGANGNLQPKCGQTGRNLRHRKRSYSVVHQKSSARTRSRVPKKSRHA
ncbi:unnamed protein product [Calicophoron daubneyi]|uniref:F-box domain-containing protein n=1 Tax=Calicophoron daubneyi TaxID=300641 RepID=A0AAV2TGJ1_CALDB